MNRCTNTRRVKSDLVTVRQKNLQLFVTKKFPFLSFSYNRAKRAALERSNAKGELKKERKKKRKVRYFIFMLARSEKERVEQNFLSN